MLIIHYPELLRRLTQHTAQLEKSLQTADSLTDLLAQQLVSDLNRSIAELKQWLQQHMDTEGERLSVLTERLQQLEAVIEKLSSLGQQLSSLAKKDDIVALSDQLEDMRRKLDEIYGLLSVFEAPNVSYTSMRKKRPSVSVSTKSVVDVVGDEL